MPCFHPREIVVKHPKPVYEWISQPDGSVKRGRLISMLSQYVIQVPCGKCPACLALQQSQWSFRIEQEAINGGHASSLFVTFTYDNEHLPSDYGLHKEEVQKYLHDLRQLIDRKYAGTYKESRPKCRYYFCGEYGSRRGRPHFHAILFFSKPIDWLLIQKAWGKGIVDIREFSSARAGYVAKYSVKQLELDYEGRPRPFHMQSQGIGKCFLNSHSSLRALHLNGYCLNKSNRKVKIPRYYIEKLSGKRYRTFEDKLGCVHKQLCGASFGSQAFLQLNALAEKRFNERYRIERALYGERSVPFETFLRQKQDKLEHELIKLNLKSPYYVQSAYESRFS